MRDRKKKQKNDKKREEHKRANNQNHGGGAKHALTALELKIHGEDMTEDTKRSRHIKKRLRGKGLSKAIDPNDLCSRLGIKKHAVMHAENNTHDQKRKRHLQHISEQNEKRSLGTVNAVHVGEAPVTASLRADIRTVKKAGDQNGTVDATEKIGDDHRNDGTDREGYPECRLGSSKGHAVHESVL